MSSIREQAINADKGAMTAAQEKAFDAKVEKHFRSHRELPAGRNFTCWNREKNVAGDTEYRQNFDSIFPNSPGSGY